jgi:PAS domain S-box-containing protein
VSFIGWSPATAVVVQLRNPTHIDLDAAPAGAQAPERAPDPRVDEVVAQLAHELKTPLAIVLGRCGRLLDAERMHGADADDVVGIRGAAYTLLERVEELLHVARLGSGRLTLDTRRVDVATVVRQTVAPFAGVADSRNQRLLVTTPARLHACIDDDKLVTVLSNLVVNALKFTPAGGLVRCSLGAHGGRIRLEVADSGPGIAPALREAVFERYRRAPGTGARGTGLGLAIVRELVEVHGGAVTIGDAPEGGALFVVEVTAGPTGVASDVPPSVGMAERQRPAVERLQADLAAGERRRPDAPSAAGRRPAALIVTDDEQLGAFVAELLGDRFAVSHARRPIEALRTLAADATDVVVLDAAGGAHTAASLRRRPTGTRVLALAASAEDVAALLAAGADDCVAKPFAATELAARTSRLADARRAEARSAATAAALDRAFDASTTAMLATDACGQVLHANVALRHLLAERGDTLEGRAVESILHPDDHAGEALQRALVLDGRLLVDRSERRLRRGDGSYVGARVTATRGADESGPPCLLWLVEPVGAPGPA